MKIGLTHLVGGKGVFGWVMPAQTPLLSCKLRNSYEDLKVNRVSESV
jgi:hypothetical protein